MSVELGVEPEPPVLVDVSLFFFSLVLDVLDLPLFSVVDPDPPVLDPDFIGSVVPPLVPPVVEPELPWSGGVVDPPDCAKAAPAASIEITANRFHQLFCMDAHSC